MISPTPAARPRGRLPDRAQFCLVLGLTLMIACAVSQVTARWLGFRFASSLPFSYGKSGSPTRVFVSCSSLGYYGLDWNEVATNHGWFIRRFDIPGGSPCESEGTQAQVTNATVSIMVTSIFDQDESVFSEYRAPLVPLHRTVTDLMATHSSWAFSKRTLSRYPEYWTRQIFPTACASIGVMVGFRAKLQHLRGHGSGDPENEKAVLNGNTGNLPTERVSEWDTGRVLRNAANMRAAAQGVHFFHGPKQAALERMIATALSHGSAYVVIMPVTPEYRRLVAPNPASADFETFLASLQKEFPAMHLIRIDQTPGLVDSRNFWDLVHLNVYGRAIANQALEQGLPPPDQ